MKKAAVLCEFQPQHQLLDVAAGNGEAVRRLRALIGCTITGLDCDPKRASEDVRFGDAAAMPFGDEAFDGVMIECSLSQIEKTELTEETSESKEAVVDNTNELSDEEIATAKEIAAGYYSGTVFEVNSMEFIEAEVNPRAEGECNFMVNVSIGGVVQEVDRMISLNKVNDLWEVVSEGY